MRKILLLLSFFSYSIYSMRPQITINVNPVQEIRNIPCKCIAHYITKNILESDNEKLEEIFHEIVTKQKKPKIYPELEDMRKFIIAEVECDC